ncbi:MAG: hypothetical protein HY088_01980 [Ignavibacteriales bacterium]|nr:hypothetical protein [Ignavibacteriales bacterium]
MENFMKYLHLRRVAGFFTFAILLNVITVHVLVAGDTPLKTVQQFKQSLDENDLVAMCGLMTETDGSEPLKRAHYEQMQQSLEGLVKLWQGVSFSYGEPETNTSQEPNRSIVKVRVTSQNQEIRFTLLKFSASWYILDIEIFFK